MTGQKPIFHVSPVGPMAAIFFALLYLGLFYSHAGATSAVPDLKLNDKDGKVTIASNSTLSATVQLHAGDQNREQADWWIAAETPMGWYYYEYPNIWHFSEDGVKDLMPAYQGVLFNMTEPLEVLHMTGLPAGAYVFYFGVDTTVDGLMDLEIMSYDRGDLEVATTEAPFDGYNLFSPIGSTTTYLIDNDGDIVHSWSSDYRPGQSVYLLEDSTLFRTANTEDTAFNVGGAGGRVERFGWSGARQWKYEYRSDQYRLHHDI